LLENPGKDEDFSHELIRLADIFNALGKCWVCNTDIVRSDALAAAIVDHYGLEGDEADEASEALERAISDSDVEVGDWEDPSVCSYHGNVIRRDD